MKKYVSVICFKSESELKFAFQMVPVHPNDYPLLVFQFEEHLLKSVLHKWVLQHKFQVSHGVHILDDFVMASIDHAKGIWYKQVWGTLFNDIVFPITEEKDEGPNHVLFCGHRVVHNNDDFTASCR